MVDARREEGFTYRRTGALFALFVIFCAPSGLVTWMADTAPDPASAGRGAAILGAGFGGYALLFALLVVALPRVLADRGRGASARQIKCTAFHASLGASILTSIATVSRVPIGGPEIRVAASGVVAAAVFGGLLWVKGRYFDEICGGSRWI